MASWRSGSSRARFTIAAPVFSSPSNASSVSSSAAVSSATPPPGTMPSSSAARVAWRASSTRCFFSFISVSVAAPTLTTATPPDSFASRSCSFSRSKSESVFSISCLICLMRDLIASLSPAPSMIVVESLSMTTLRARPSCEIAVFSSLRPISSVITSPPVRIAMSSSMRLRRSPKPGRLDGDGGEGAAELVDDDRGERLALDVLGHDQQRPAALDDRLEHGQDVLDRADLLVRDQDERLVEHGLHALGVRDHVRRQVALVELHALGELELEAEGLALLDVHDAVLADLLDRVGDDVADLRSRAEMVATRAMSPLPSTSFDCALIDSTTLSVGLLDAALQRPSGWHPR